MTDKNRQRVFITVIAAVTIVILWLLYRQGIAGAARSQNVTNNAGDTISYGGMSFDLSNVPPVSYSGSTMNYIGGSAGCLLCYKGYQRIETPTVAPPMPTQTPPVINMYNYLQQQAQQTYQRPRVIAYNY